MSDYVPLSVRYGGRRAKVSWWLKGQRERLALSLAPWLGGRTWALDRVRDELGNADSDMDAEGLLVVIDSALAACHSERSA